MDKKVWFITGSSRGLGKSIVEAALKNGDYVIATARKPEMLDDLKEKYEEQLFPCRLDVTNPNEALDAVKAGIEKFGRIDKVLCNAGYGNMATIEDVTLQDFREQIDTLVFGVVYVVKAVLPYMREQKSGHIMITSSVGGRIGSPGLAAYQTGKWAIEGFGEVLNAEVSPLGIKVTLIEPSAIDTDWAGSSMHIKEPKHPEYKHVQDMIDFIRTSTVGPVVNDPNKIAEQIVKISHGEDIPLRLLCGSDAVEYAIAADKKKIEEAEKWRAVSNSTSDKE
jgi:NAD(P)-dependent dehydrogenase (short-subunit alcohol dehydrogenase family)